MSNSRPQDSLILLLEHYGIGTKDLVSVNLSADARMPVRVKCTYHKFTTDGKIAFIPTEYQVTEIETRGDEAP